jgi:hypothetical protein
MTTLTRRGLVAGTAALPALPTSALAVDDPAFAAIARHRKAYAAHAKLFNPWDGRNQDPPAELAKAAGDAEAGALNALLGDDADDTCRGSCIMSLHCRVPASRRVHAGHGLHLLGGRRDQGHSVHAAPCRLYGEARLREGCAEVAQEYHRLRLSL